MSDEKIVEGEVVGGPPDPEPAPKKRAGFFHPGSGALILAIDWLAFGMDAATGFVGIALLSLLAFAATFYGVLFFQRRNGDSPQAAVTKALLGALAAGVPFPITGTLVGGAILALSGLPDLPWRRR